MTTSEQLADLLRRHGVDDDALLDALKWKFRKIYTEKEMVLRERDKLREALAVSAEWYRTHLDAIKSLDTENDKLRAELKALKGDAWEEAGQ
jgi:chromosome segregation ATPase